MAFESFAHVPLTDEVLVHIWEGEPGDATKGGHRFGLGREGKTEFPQDWTIQMVANAVRLTLEKPEWVMVAGPYTRCTKLIRDVLVRVQLSSQSGVQQVVTAFPVCGIGVMRNDKGRRVDVPLEMLKGQD